MVILAQIEKVVKSQIPARDGKPASEMFQLILSDKTKPAQFRASTFFTTYMSEEKFRGTFGPGDPTDERVTVAVSELAPKDNFIKVRGQVLHGWQTTEQLQAWADAAEADKAGKPAPATPPAPARKAA